MPVVPWGLEPYFTSVAKHVYPVLQADTVDRFTTRAAPGGGWDVIDLRDGHGDRIVAHCDNRNEAQAIAWFFRGDYECGTRLLLEALAEIDRI